MTTDGELAHRLMHPSGGVEREYLVRLRGDPSGAAIEQLRSGVPLQDGLARFDRIEREGERGNRREAAAHTTFRVVLREGRNREVRRLWSAVGFEVSRLLRIRYGPIELPRDLRPGRWRRADPAATSLLGAGLAPPPERPRSAGPSSTR